MDGSMQDPAGELPRIHRKFISQCFDRQVEATVFHPTGLEARMMHHHRKELWMKMATTTRVVTLLLVTMMVTLLTVNGVAYGNSAGPLVDNVVVTVQGSEVIVTYGSGSGFIIDPSG
jgi:hypothetical protein